MNKILYIGGFELPDKNAAAHRVVGNAKALRELGFEVIFIGINKNRSELSVAQYFEGFEYYELKYPKTFKEWLGYLSDIGPISNFISKDKEITKIIAYNYPAIALNSLRKLRLKVFADCTEWYKPQGPFFFRLVKGLDVLFRMRVVHKRLDGIIVISDFLENYYKNKVPCINIPPLVDIRDSKWVCSSKGKRSELVFTYSGSPGLGFKDRLDIIIKVLSQLKRETNKTIKLNIIGVTEDHYREVFGDSKDMSFNFSFVKFWGRMNHLKALNIIKESKYFVFFRDNNLSNTAGFPTKFVESVSLGIPVITNSSSNINTYFKKYPDIGLIVKNNEDLLGSIKDFVNLELDTSETSKEIFHFANYKEEFIKLFAKI